MPSTRTIPSTDNRGATAAVDGGVIRRAERHCHRAARSVVLDPFDQSGSSNVRFCASGCAW